MLNFYFASICVSDMALARDFYVNQIGFKIQSDAGFPGIVQLENSSITLIMLLVDKPTNIDYPNQAQTMFAFRVDDILTTHNELMQRNVDLIYDKPLVLPEGLLQAFRDPFGNVHEIIQWPLETGKLEYPLLGDIQINVVDIEESIDFYSAKLGFKVEKQYSDDMVQLAHKNFLFSLNKVEKTTDIDYPNEAQSLIGMKTDNLARSISNFKTSDIHVIYDKPQEYPEGMYTAIKDPSGNVLEIYEIQR